MTYYTSPSFFLVLTVLILPAAVLGVTGRSQRAWGMVANVIMLVCLLSASVAQALAFLGFCALAGAAAQVTLGSWRSGKRSLGVYRACLAATCAPLVTYKVGGVFDLNLLGFIGISYATFKAVQVLIEIRDGLIEEMSPLDYLYFLTFFAQLTSGPIDRSRRFLADVHERRSRAAYLDLLSRGILLILVGAVFQLAIASVFKFYYVPGRPIAGLYGVARQVANAYLYALYLFFDFAGSSMMAVGVSYCFGIRCPRNFRAPFAAIDMKDFWNRWHITLSTWLRDFVFMRFVRWATKRRLFSDRVASASAGYLVNMLLMGAWHGLTVDYLAYGAYHGVLLAATEVYQKRSAFYRRHKKELWYRVLSWFVTMQLVIFGFALFSGQLHSIAERIING